MQFWGRAVSAALLALVSSAHGGVAASLDGLAVEVVNKSEPVLCAEKDNVSLEFRSAQTRAFRIEAAHPVYLPMMRGDNYEADWTACDLTGDPVFTAPVPPRKQTLYEDVETWLIGWTFSSFWRPATATVRIGDKVERNIHLIQVWGLRPNGGEELLVLYPQDGYWRIRPMTPASGVASTAFGSSFLIGPVEEQGRPIVRIKEVAFDPKNRRFTLTFEKGGSATVAMYPDANRHALDVSFDKPIQGAPFAMMRSMYITEFNNDVARIAVRERGAKGWREVNIMAFDKAVATDIWAGRLTPSQHNTSSPDMVFNSFSDTDKPKRPKNEPPPGITVKGK